MSASQILNITDIAPTQNNKATTHNNAIAALEQSSNKRLVNSSIGAGPWTLTEDEFTRNFLFQASGASSAFELTTPTQVNSVNSKRVFAVKNADATYTCTVRAAGSGSTVALALGEAALLFQDTNDIISVVAALPAGTNTILTGSGAPSGGTGVDGDIYIDTTAMDFYGPKAGGSWPSGVSLTGPAGPGYAATSTTSLSIGTGTKSLTTQSALAYIVGSRVRLASDADPAADFMEGVVTAYNVGTGAMDVDVDKSEGSGTHTDWNISIAGEVGSLTGSNVTYDFGIFFGGTPTSSQLMAMFVAGRAFDLPDDFAGAVGKIKTNPTSSFVIDVKVNGSGVGSVTISTGGAFTFTTTGADVNITTGDYIELVAPASVDATAADIAISFLGTRVY